MRNETPEEPKVVYLRAGVRQAAEMALKAEVAAAKARARLHEKIVDAYGTVRMRDLVRASGLTRQRIHQILNERESK